LNHWNHRVVNCPSENDGDDFFTFREVYYDEEDRPETYSDPFMCGDTIEELHVLVARLSAALEKPTLHEGDFASPITPQTNITGGS
jgi:hypothetical protein